MLSRQKKHACTMCHKRFDRPSTLKKHLLVHTGEKAFVCDTCGRRFGVASNLNRHVRKCILKPVNTPPSSTKSSSGSPPASDAPPVKLVGMLADMHLPVNTRCDPEKQISGRSGSGITRTSADALSNESSHCAPQANSAATRAAMRSKPLGQKRRRRAPSPSQWIPCSLLSFNLTSEYSHRSAALPAPPVKRNPPYEERNSWDENTSVQPYHPCGWKGVLPGPGLGLGLGLGGRDVRNLNLGGNGGFMLGRVMVV
ncbi:hypothetical protein BD779DRAFT_1663823 [Infundibulicybe gibba]|nr:hypothetical protein BD779DRAFT_1663823 [Infundibulicybe gibba]